MEISRRIVILFWIFMAIALGVTPSFSSTLFIVLVSILPPMGMWLVIIYYCKKECKTDEGNIKIDEEKGMETYIFGSEENSNQELQFFTYERVVAATDDFSNVNKLGQGGYGPVYKGILDDQEVAVKRLSRSSGQGEVEFMNEAKLIAKLQHTNLVKLIGCCTQKGEKILIYEYMPNKSLDSFLFDSEKRNAIDWTKSLNIIDGIVQGLLYLHKYSRLKIIHRDLKASNILLDSEMNPKISDFGLARIYETKESQANTQRVVGTYGYMAPEYAMEGIFSPKSDVYSFGVLLLEILTGRKNNSFYHPDGPINLVKYAWNLWTETRGSELSDPIILGDSYENNQFLRYIHIGLLCVQDCATDRPSTAEILSMINNEGYQLRMPKEPAFYKVMDLNGGEVSHPIAEGCSLNEASISEIAAR